MIFLLQSVLEAAQAASAEGNVTNAKWLAFSVVATGFFTAAASVITQLIISGRAAEKAAVVAADLKESNASVAQVTSELKDSNVQVAKDVAQVKTDVAQGRIDIHRDRMSTFQKLDVIHDLVNGGKLSALHATVVALEANVTSKKQVVAVQATQINKLALKDAIANLREAKKLYEDHAKQIAEGVLRAQEIKNRERELGGNR